MGVHNHGSIADKRQSQTCLFLLQSKQSKESKLSSYLQVIILHVNLNNGTASVD